MTVQQALANPKASLVYNARGANLGKGQSATDAPLEDPFGLVYVTVPKGKAYQPTTTVEPLVLRANAGDWIHVELVTEVRGREPVFTTPEPASRFGLTYASPYNSIQIASSPNVGLHPQLVTYDIRSSDGANVGNNAPQTVPPCKPPAPCSSTDYWWYAGTIENGKATPVEFGAPNLLPPDPLIHPSPRLFPPL